MPARRIAHYEVRSSLGAGGMGEVYRARDTKLDRDVALKLLPASVAGDPDRLSRFSREARLLASLNHPHIAGIYGTEDSGTSPVLVLELVEGETLAERLARGAVPPREAVARGDVSRRPVRDDRQSLAHDAPPPVRIERRAFARAA